MAYISDKYVTDDKLLIKLCLGLFICTFIYSTGFIFCLYDLSVCLSHLQTNTGWGCFESGMLRKVFGC